MPTLPDLSQPYIFVSYASPDRDQVEQVVHTLRSAGVAVWIDTLGIVGGANYGPVIVAAIRDAAALVVSCSVAAFRSPNVRREIALAGKYHRPIIPVRLEPVQLPDELAGALNSDRWIDLFDRPGASWLAEVVRALHELGVGAQSTPTTVPPRMRDHMDADVANLPSPLTHMIGREEDVARVAQLLTHHRMVTLIGPPGIGKTRIAIAAAKAVQSHFVDGVAFVNMARVRDGPRMMNAIAAALSGHETAEPGSSEHVIELIGHRTLLLVLDGKEQVTGVGPEISHILIGCPNLTVLATSRAPFLIQGERAETIAPLPIPDTGDRPDFGLAENPCVVLFLERAREIGHDFSNDETELRAVAELCRRLAGSPSAIEHAATRSRLLTPAAQLARLQPMPEPGDPTS